MQNLLKNQNFQGSLEIPVDPAMPSGNKCLEPCSTCPSTPCGGKSDTFPSSAQFPYQYFLIFSLLYVIYDL